MRAVIRAPGDGESYRTSVTSHSLGVGPFAAELVVLRGANAPDVLPRHERRLDAEIVSALRHGPDSCRGFRGLASLLHMGGIPNNVYTRFKGYGPPTRLDHGSITGRFAPGIRPTGGELESLLGPQGGA